jgi:hypothetical protein
VGRKAARRGAKNNATDGGYNVKGKTSAKAKNDEYMSGLGKRIAEMGRVTGYQGKVTGGPEKAMAYRRDKWGAGIWGK